MTHRRKPESAAPQWSAGAMVFARHYLYERIEDGDERHLLASINVSVWVGPTELSIAARRGARWRPAFAIGRSVVAA